MGYSILGLGRFRLGPPRISIAHLLGYFLLGLGRVGHHGLGYPQDEMYFKGIN